MTKFGSTSRWHFFMIAIWSKLKIPFDHVSKCELRNSNVSLDDLYYGIWKKKLKIRVMENNERRVMTEESKKPESFLLFNSFSSPSPSGECCCSAIFNDDLLHEILHENAETSKFLFSFHEQEKNFCNFSRCSLKMIINFERKQKRPKNEQEKSFTKTTVVIQHRWKISKTSQTHKHTESFCPDTQTQTAFEMMSYFYLFFTTNLIRRGETETQKVFTVYLI